MKNKLFLPILFLVSLTSCQSNFAMNQLTSPSKNKITTTNNRNVSQITLDSYTAFARKFTSLMMEANNTEQEKSLGISIPDAYICFAITGVISDDDARNDVLSYLELESVSELRTAVKEIVDTLGTLYKSEKKLYGGYNLNSVWLDPKQVYLIKEKDEELYHDLEEYFDAAIYLEALTSDTANQYLKDYGLKDLPTPEIELDDDNPCALSSMSVYYCLDYFDDELIDNYKNQYRSGNHKLDYAFGTSRKKVDYIQSKNLTQVYENENFYGSNMSISALNIDFFLPNDKYAMPSSILNDVLNKNYTIKQGTYIDYDGEVHETDLHDVNISAPYFSLDNKSELDRGYLSRILPVITNKGAGERLAKPIGGGNLFLDYIKQFSVMKFNYDGFYSCSVTIAGSRATSAGDQGYKQFDLVLNHPYIFEVNKRVMVGTTSHKLPIVIGEIVDPNYKD